MQSEVVVRKRVVFEFDDEDPETLTYACGPDDRLAVDRDGPAIYVSRSGARLLAEILAKMSEGSYAAGFHMHLREDFDPDKPDAVTVMLTD